MMDGWIKLHRKIWDNPIVTKDPEHLAVWIWLLTNATHKKRAALFGKDKIELLPGQLITGQQKIADETHVSKTRVGRILKDFKNESQIETLTNSRGSLISIVRWIEYQQSEPPIEPQADCKRTASGLQADTIQERKNDIREDVLYTTRARGMFDDQICNQAARTRLQDMRAHIAAANEKWRAEH